MIDVVLIGLGSLLLAISIAFIAYAALEGFGFRNQTLWKDAIGVIEESSLQYDSDGGCYPAIRYKFLVGDQPYWGNQSHFLAASQEASSNQAIVEKLPIGQGVIVYFNPADPENDSTLESPASSEIKRFHEVIIAFVILGVMLLLGVLSLYFGINPNLTWSPMPLELFDTPAV